MSLNSLTYVCVVSDHNLPELEAILSYQPKTIILIATKDYFAAAERLKKEVIKSLGKSEKSVVLADTSGLTGEELSNSQQWVKNTLVSLLEQHEAPYFLNLTGGTKAMAIALLYGYNWAECHYKAFGGKEIERFVIKEQQPVVLTCQAPPTKPVTIQQAVGLYCETQNLTNKLPSEKEQHLAQKLWDALDQQDVGIHALFKTLDKIWSQQRNEKKWQQDQVTLEWSEFNDLELVKPWLERFATLDKQSIEIQEAGVVLPGNRRARSEQTLQAFKLKGWIAGGWLEDIVYHWLADKIPADQLVLNLQTQSNYDASSQREADILLLHKGKTWVMEIKADLPPGQKLPDLENQLSGGARRYGKAQKILFIGPELKHKLEKDGRLEGFKGRCKGNQVTLCYNKAGLFETLKIQ